MTETSTSTPAEVKGRRGRAPFLGVAIAFAVVLIAAIVLVISQLGGGSGGPLNAVAEAALKTEQEPGTHAVIHGIITSPDKTIVMRGTMVTDAAGRLSGVLSFPNPKAPGGITMQMVEARSVMYMRSSLFGSLPGGAKWMKLDFSSGAPSGSPVPTTGDSEEGLKLLEKVDGVEKLGKADVRGVPTTRYRGTTGSGAKPPHLEAWIDGKGRILRMRLVNSPSRNGGETSPKIDMRTDFVGFGPVPPIRVPDPSEVFDATAIAES